MDMCKICGKTGMMSYTICGDKVEDIGYVIEVDGKLYREQAGDVTCDDCNAKATIYRKYVDKGKLVCRILPLL
jgi:hypothetical protein